MKIFKFIAGVLLGVGGVLLYQWMKPVSDDPYFFLTPKPTIIGDKYYPVERPIALYKKGSAVDFFFWNVPQPTPKLLYLIPANTPSPVVALRLLKSDDGTGDAYIEHLFDNGYALRGKNGLPILRVVISKIDESLKERIIFDKTMSEIELSSGGMDGMLFDMTGLLAGYGQYRLKAVVLSDNPELKKGLNFSIYIRQYAIK